MLLGRLHASLFLFIRLGQSFLSLVFGIPKLIGNISRHIHLPGLKLSVTSDESININFDAKPKVIISASGMCDAGRIRHHLKHNLWRPESTILFVGYQVPGTLGHALLNGAKEVKLFGENIQVHAEILNLPGISGHADRDMLTKGICI